MISPSQLESKLAVTTTEQLEKYLVEIENAIINKANTNGMDNLYVTISTKDLPKFVIDRAIQKIKQAGWDAKYESDQRDGNYIAISKTKPPKSQLSYIEFGGSQWDR